MKCPKCQFENRDEAKFCLECGEELEPECPECGKALPLGARFCDQCGHRLDKRLEEEKADAVPERERKHVTVLFSDLSGYTAMSERLDPEEVKEIMSQIFGEVAQVVTKYEGFIEKFIGDAVMALFGVPKAHEDDPVRAIRAAREIHDLVEGLSRHIEERLGETLSMHTGIHTGLVVTGEVSLDKGTHGVAGDTISLASRLSGLARAGEIVVGPQTHSQAEGYFVFESLGPTTLKGRAESIRIYKVLSPREEPSKIHRLRGLRADLIGRKAEMAQLMEVARGLMEGKGTVLSICGDAGTGKTRLVEEFKASLDLKEIQWRQGHAYAYSQNIPYFPLIDLLNRAFQIEEGDPPDRVREKVESGLEVLIGKEDDVLPYVGSLYSLSYPEIEGVSPEFWKSRLQEGIQTILSALAQRGPTVICLEDLHWADPSSLDLLRFLLSNLQYPTLFLCVYRPPFGLFTSHEFGGLGDQYREIRLQDLSASEAQDMMESLLKTQTIPPELRRFIQDKVEGNPFYLEEVINSLIESETLIPHDGGWRLSRPISESDIPSTVHGVISSRLDRLEKEKKRILQEASVIGRAFLYEILKRITELREQIDQCLSGLERFDLIRTRSLEPELEYVFKHALTQEVVYNGLLRKERHEIHERIARVMEQLFHDRLPEFYETLAFHFKQGRSLGKAVDYLMNSGEKSLKRYSLQESHQYFREAFELLSSKTDRTKEEETLVIDLLLKWSLVYHFRGAFSGLIDLFKTHVGLTQSLDDKSRLGMFYGWLGFALREREQLKDAYRYLCEGLRLGEESEDQRVIGYVCAWLSLTCADMGLLDKAIAFGERAQKISGLFESDQELFRFSMDGIGLAHYCVGECRKQNEVGKILLDYGRRKSDIRSTALGHQTLGYGYFLAGDFQSAIECFQRAIKVSVDPIRSCESKFNLGYSYLFNGQLQEAEDTLDEVVRHSEHFGAEIWGTSAQGLQVVVSIVKGNLSQGLRIGQSLLRVWKENESRYRYAVGEYLQGKVYSEIAQGAGPKSLLFLARNIGFLLRNLPFARRKAEYHFKIVIEVAKEIGAKGVLGQAYFDLGLLHKTKGKIDKARECISEAVSLFEQCGAEVYLKQAKEALEQLG